MAKIWGQIVDDELETFEDQYMLSKEIKDSNIICRAFNDLCDLWLNEHNVNWVGHSSAKYPIELKKLIDKLEKNNLRAIYSAA